MTVDPTRRLQALTPGVGRELFVGQPELVEEEDEAVQREEDRAPRNVGVQEGQLVPTTEGNGGESLFTALVPWQRERESTEVGWCHRSGNAC
jgi:hypothetical protein